MISTDKINILEKLLLQSPANPSLFYEAFEKCGMIRKNYSEYMTTSPMNCDIELLRLPSADYDLCCALLTMLLREDHFSNGSFNRRMHKGQIRPILERVIKLLNTNHEHISSFSEKSLAALNGFYVYALIDPRDNNVFYIGKGIGNRIFAHEIESEKEYKSEKVKLQKITEIRNSGYHVKRVLLNWELTEDEAFAAEATLINLLNLMPTFQLTNMVSGHHIHEALTAEEFETQYGAKLLNKSDIKHNILVIKINKLYRKDLSAEELYNVVRGYWAASIKSIKTRKVEYVFGVYNGLIVAVYKPDEWHYGYDEADPPQKNFLKLEDYEKLKNRIYFTCKDYSDLDEAGRFYLNKSIANLKFNQSAQNPITYLSPDR